jgi:hypothetical protein
MGLIVSFHSQFLNLDPNPDLILYLLMTKMKHAEMNLRLKGVPLELTVLAPKDLIALAPKVIKFNLIIS